MMSLEHLNAIDRALREKESCLRTVAVEGIALVAAFDAGKDWSVVPLRQAVEELHRATARLGALLREESTPSHCGKPALRVACSGSDGAERVPGWVCVVCDTVFRTAEVLHA